MMKSPFLGTLRGYLQEKPPIARRLPIPHQLSDQAAIFKLRPILKRNSFFQVFLKLKIS